MDKTLKAHYMNRIDEKLSELPWYVTEYIDSRKRKLSPTTLLNYCHDFIIFFDWLIAEKLAAASRKDVELPSLEKLTVREIENFLFPSGVPFGKQQIYDQPQTVRAKIAV